MEEREKKEVGERKGKNNWRTKWKWSFCKWEEDQELKGAGKDGRGRE